MNAIGKKIMGRQIAIAATAVDEAAFLEFLRGSAEIQLLQPCAPRRDEIWVERFAPYSAVATEYYIWNKHYRWKPNYGRVDRDVKGHGGWYFVEDILHGPVIQFCRTDMQRLIKKGPAMPQHGRIYWARYNRQKGFSKWYEGIVRWIRKNGRNLCPQSPSGLFCLPDAWQLWQNRTV